MKNQHYQHLTLEQRIEIQQCLAHGMSFKDIGKRIGKDQTTVSREVKRHIIVRQTTITRIAKDGTPINEPCKLLLKAPFVCNPCKHFHRICAFDKHVYSARDAQESYESDLRTSREGIPLNKETFYENDRIITEGIRNGQHLYHILQTHDLGVSTPTVYRHLKKGYLSVSAVEFPRVVKFKPRSRAYAPYVPKACKTGRTYADFLLFREEMGCTAWIEMDTVIGRVGGKVILTFDFIFCNFMIGFLLPDKSAASVSSAILMLKKRLDDHGIPFGTVFPIILTDNGGEFSDVAAIENDLYGNKETHLFFCDPSQSSQKPHVEKNHTLFRDIVPQGASFDEFTQDTVNLIFSHVNSVKRKTLNGRTPYQLLAFTYGDDLPSLLGIEDIPPERVVQSPLLLKH
jgi:IS30 family transposase